MTRSTTPALAATYPPFPVPFFAGRGDEMTDIEGRSYLDFYGGHCVCVTGHSHPAVVDAHRAPGRRAALLLHRRPAARARGGGRSPRGLRASAAWTPSSSATPAPRPTRTPSRWRGWSRAAAGSSPSSGSFHGRTLLALSVTDSPKLQRRASRTCWPRSTSCPSANGRAGRLRPLATWRPSSSSPSRAWPASGPPRHQAWFRPPGAHAQTPAPARLRRDPDRPRPPRRPFAASLYGVAPDLMTLAKGMASGVPMGALLMSAAVAACLDPGDLGSTFGGGPLACAALLATLSMSSDERLMDRARACGPRVSATAWPARSSPRCTATVCCSAFASRVAPADLKRLPAQAHPRRRLERPRRAAPDAAAHRSRLVGRRAGRGDQAFTVEPATATNPRG